MNLATLLSGFDEREYSIVNYDPDTEIGGVWNYDEALTTDITFSTSLRSTPTKAGAIVVNTVRNYLSDYPIPVIIHAYPRYAISRIARHFYSPPPPPSEPDGLPGVLVYDNVIFESQNVVAHPGTVIGSDGFGYERGPDGYFRMPHLGGVIISPGVEIGANCTIDRGAFSYTTLGVGTKLDNLVHVAHNCQLGSNVMVAAGVKFSGSVTVGSDVWIGTNSTIMQGVTIGDRATIGIGTTVLRDVEPHQTVVGHHRIIETKDHQPGVIR